MIARLAWRLTDPDPVLLGLALRPLVGVAEEQHKGEDDSTWRHNVCSVEDARRFVRDLAAEVERLRAALRSMPERDAMARAEAAERVLKDTETTLTRAIDDFRRERARREAAEALLRDWLDDASPQDDVFNRTRAHLAAQGEGT